MTQPTTVIVHVEATPGEDDEAVRDAVTRLRSYLRVVDLGQVGALTRPRGTGHPASPSETKGEVATDLLAVATGLALHAESLTALRDVLLALASWRARDRRRLHVSIAGHELELDDATAEQQERIVDAYLASLPARS